MAKRKNKDADMGLPDTQLIVPEVKVTENVRFDEEYFRKFRQAMIQKEATAAAPTEPQEPTAVLVTGCEYSVMRTDLTIIRDCKLSKIPCTERGWFQNFCSCDLRARALKEQQKGDLP